MLAKIIRGEHNERGIAAIVMAISLIALFGMAVITIDYGSAWATRRNLVTGTDAAALAAAREFATGQLNPCSATDQTTARSHSTTVLQQNNPTFQNDATSTPNGFSVEDYNGNPLASNPTLCPVGANFAPGHVRFDGRGTANTPFAGVFGFGNTKPISSSTAVFGYANSTTGDLRPWPVCDQHAQFTYPNVPTFPPPNGGPYPHFYIWSLLKNGKITQAQYDAYFGVGADSSGQGDYPTKSPNDGSSYLSPAQGGGVVHRIDVLDGCGSGSGWKGWLFAGGTKDLKGIIDGGWDGTVTLSPPACENSDGSCGVKPGNTSATGALPDIACSTGTPSANCFKFPLIVDNFAGGNGRNTEVDQVAFVFVILRGWTGCRGNGGCTMDMEFTDSIITNGSIGPNPSGTTYTARGIGLCTADHDNRSNPCPV